MNPLPGSGNHLVDSSDREYEEELRERKKRLKEENEELTNCEDI